MRFSFSEDCKSISVLGLQTLDQALTCLSTRQPSSSDSAEPTGGEKEPSSAQEDSSLAHDSPMGFMDDRAHEVYSLGLIPESPGDQKPEADITFKEGLGEETLKNNPTIMISAETNCNGSLKNFQLPSLDEPVEENRNGCAVQIPHEKLDVKMSNEITHL